MGALKRTVKRLIVLSVITSVISSIVATLQQKSKGAPTSFEHWPDVPKNPEA